MKANLIKDEENLDDLHPKKNVIRPKKKYRDYSLLNVNSKKFKIKYGKKNRIVRRKPLKFTSIRQPEPKEDLDTDSSEQEDYKPSRAKKPISISFFGDDEMVPGSDKDECEDSKDFEVCKDFFMEEPASTKTYMLTSHASFMSAVLLGTGGEPETDSDYEMGVRVKANNLFELDDDEPEMVSDDHTGVQVKSTRFQRDGGEPEMVSDDQTGVQVKSAL